MAIHDVDPKAPSASDLAREDERVEEILRRGPAGAFAVVGVSTFIVIAIVFIFYFFAFLPRGTVQ
jgi:hypothetical protein